MFNEIWTRGGRGRRGGKKGRRGEMRVQGDHENSLKEEMVGRGNTVAVVNIALTSLHCLGRGFDNQKAARPSGKSENKITSGDQTFKACICVGHWSKRYYIPVKARKNLRYTVNENDHLPPSMKFWQQKWPQAEPVCLFAFRFFLVVKSFYVSRKTSPRPLSFLFVLPDIDSSWRVFFIGI